MKLLYITSRSGKRINGFMLSAIHAARAAGIDFTMACNMDGAEKPGYAEDCKIYGIKTVHVDFERNPLALKNILAHKQLNEIIRKGNYDVIHCNTPIGGVLGRICGFEQKVPVIIYQAHGFHFYQGAPLKNWLLYYPVERLLAHLTDVLITINREDYERAKKFKAGKVYYVPGVGIDLNKFNTDAVDTAGIRSEFGLKKQDFLLLSVGEINCNKNHRVVIEALGKIKNVGIYYIICGTGPLTAEYENLAKQLGIEKQIIFAGYRKDILEFYKTADVFLFPSYREGLPVALMEAMACGLPVICSNIRGNTDLIENGVSGMLTGNDPDSVADAILTMYRDENLRKRYANAAREKIEQYSIEHVSEMMREIYQSALQET